MALGDTMAITFPTIKSAGQNIGEALGSGFQALADMKMKEYSQRQQMKMQQQAQQENMRYQQGLQQEQQLWKQGVSQENNLQTLMAMGYPQEKAQAMANTDPALLKEIVKYDMQQGGNEALAEIVSSLYGGNQQNGQQAPMQNEQPMLPGQEQQPTQTGTNIPVNKLKALPRRDLITTTQMIGKQKQHEENLAFKKSEALKKHGETEEKGARKEQEVLKSFLDEDRQKFQSLKEQKHIAEEMLNIVNNYKGKFPGTIMGNVPDQLKKMWINDPKVRRFMELQAKLVRASAEKGGGRASKNLYQLAEAGKTGVGQPVETIQESLRNYLDEYEQGKYREQHKANLRDKKTGRYPTDLPDRLTEYELAQEDPLNYPQYFTKGEIYEDNGKRYRVKNGEWKEI